MSFSQVLGLKRPLIVAPMAGGPSSTELIVASLQSGALGSIAAAYLNPAQIEEKVSEVRAQTNSPFAINLFAPGSCERIDDQSWLQAVSATREFRAEFSLPEPQNHFPYAPLFEDQFAAVLRLKPRVLSFVFGTLPEPQIRAARNEKIYLMGTATTPAEAYCLEKCGVDAIVAQGKSAGGHRGMFQSGSEDSDWDTLALLREIKQKAKVLVIAAGGIMSAKDVSEALASRADAVQMGTAFLATLEAGTSDPYRAKLLESNERVTALTRVFSGRLARGIVNRFMIEMERHSESILPFPAQNAFTRDLREASANLKNDEFLSMWCGSGKGELFKGSARELIAQLFTAEETQNWKAKV